MEKNLVIKYLVGLGQSARLDIVRELVNAGQIGLTPSVLADRLDVIPATLSFHLKAMVYADLITQERVGRHLIYRAQTANINALLTYLNHNLYQGQTCPPPQRHA